MGRLIVLTMALSLLAACTSYEHIQSQQRMTDGIGALQAAEGRARGNEADTGIAFSSVESLRLALAEDAADDLSRAQRGFGHGEDADRISALSRAALKGWQAGAQGGATVDSATTVGDRLCRALGSAAPPRDCGLLTINPVTGQSLAQLLSTLEIQADIILPYDALQENVATAGNPSETVERLSAATSVTAETLPRLEAPVPVLAGWADRQRTIYLCSAIAGENALFNIEDRGLAAAQAAQTARSKLVGTPAAPGPLTTAMAAYSQSSLPTINTTTIQTAASDCNLLASGA